MVHRQIRKPDHGKEEVKKLHIGNSPLTNRIFAGHVLRDGCTFGTGKQDVTGSACFAVCEHVASTGVPTMVVSYRGEPKYEITVKKLTPDTAEADVRISMSESRAVRQGQGQTDLGTATV